MSGIRSGGLRVRPVLVLAFCLVAPSINGGYSRVNLFASPKSILLVPCPTSGVFGL